MTKKIFVQARSGKVVLSIDGKVVVLSPDTATRVSKSLLYAVNECGMDSANDFPGCFITYITI